MGIQWLDLELGEVILEQILDRDRMSCYVKEATAVFVAAAEDVVDVEDVMEEKYV